MKMKFCRKLKFYAFLPDLFKLISNGVGKIMF